MIFTGSLRAALAARSFPFLVQYAIITQWQT